MYGFKIVNFLNKNNNIFFVVAFHSFHRILYRYNHFIIRVF